MILLDLIKTNKAADIDPLPFAVSGMSAYRLLEFLLAEAVADYLFGSNVRKAHRENERQLHIENARLFYKIGRAHV